ncbi:uncharacterized protein LOC18432519 [Amborella trichopoda]|uniref:Uncharacterized protein n=1 Tax=Amborella trichopoda TaxID=13333 RepID=W1PBF2_AMBTC|nr:uncharacterized protein LOC18432519 [Amborella trichopoda]ERN04360.1 hypothetical protein AMTR_s00147p00063520 [Amborella trichopoda]|eukprot:XP_006842685.1 uncharacterized protein LOC18432519 [Amborella trichopoda]
MAMASLKMGNPIHSDKVQAESLKVRCQRSGHESLSFRRDIMVGTTASLSSFVIFLHPAEARVSKGEMRRKIMEKLQKLREKAGLVKPEIEDDSMKTNEKESVGGRAQKKELSITPAEPLVEITNAL